MQCRGFSDADPPQLPLSPITNHTGTLLAIWGCGRDKSLHTDQKCGRAPIPAESGAFRAPPSLKRPTPRAARTSFYLHELGDPSWFRDHQRILLPWSLTLRRTKEHKNDIFIPKWDTILTTFHPYSIKPIESVYESLLDWGSSIDDRPKTCKSGENPW